MDIIETFAGWKQGLVDFGLKVIDTKTNAYVHSLDHDLNLKTGHWPSDICQSWVGQI